MATAQRDKLSLVDRLKQPFSNLGQFLRDVWLELQRVKWPDHQETYSFTVIVIIAMIIVSIWVGLWDWIFTGLLSLLHR